MDNYLEDNDVDKDEYENERDTDALSRMTLNEEDKSTSSSSSSNNTTQQTIQPIATSSFTFHPIGITSSIFRLCVGTPRQGLIAPNTRAKIDIYTNCISIDSIIDLQYYSHIWIVFVFHLNTSNKKKITTTPAKIAPPALGGRKVGVFATRTPHRPNPIGQTLCKLDKITTSSTNNAIFTLHVSGVDLVDGTPVLDIKPFVPHYDTTINTSSSSWCLQEYVKIPHWVMDGLDKRRPVIFTTEAKNQLIQIISNPDMYTLDFYGIPSTRDSSPEEAFISLQGCIEQVLGVDVRSQFHTRKVRKGQFHAEKTTRVRESLHTPTQEDEQQQDQERKETKDKCSQQLDRLLIRYYVEYREKSSTITLGMNSVDGESINTDGSGADDTVIVYAVEYMSTIEQFKSEPT